MQQNKAKNVESKPKIVSIHAPQNIPSSRGNLSEENISKVIQVLRTTNLKIGRALRDERIILKEDEKVAKKARNLNAVKQNLIKKNESKYSLRKKIRQMRRDKVFPLPKSYTNYKKRNGLLEKNSIKT